MEPVRMVPFVSVRSQFEAQLLAARLGSEGVVWQLRGACSVYPIGNVEVLVDAEDLDRARELFLIDEVEAAFDRDERADRTFDDDRRGGPAPHDAATTRRHGWLAWLAAAAVLAGVTLRLVAALLP